MLGTDRVTFRFIAQETTPPFALAVYEIDDKDMIQAEEDIGAAVNGWGAASRPRLGPATRRV